MEGGDCRQGGRSGGGAPVNNGVLLGNGWLVLVGGGGMGVLGDMISHGGLQEVRVGLTCMRIKQCWEVKFFRGGGGGGGCKTLTWGYLGSQGRLCTSNYVNNR